MARKNRQLLVRFGRALRERREATRMTQLDLAEEAGMSESYVSKLERGLVSPSLEAIDTLARALGTTATDLVAEAERRRRG